MQGGSYIGVGSIGNWNILTSPALLLRLSVRLIVVIWVGGSFFSVESPFCGWSIEKNRHASGIVSSSPHFFRSDVKVLVVSFEHTCSASLNILSDPVDLLFLDFLIAFLSLLIIDGGGDNYKVSTVCSCDWVGVSVPIWLVNSASERLPMDLWLRLLLHRRA